MLKHKNIVVGVTGGIAVYKACDLVSKLIKQGANVDVIMTKNATEFVTPLTFESLSNRPVITDMFHRENEWEIEHIALAKKADVFVVVPATANIIGKMAQGIADDMLSTTLMATKAPVVVCPAMNTNMYNNEIFQNNLNLLKNKGVIVVEPSSGRLACGDVGVGKLADTQNILETIIKVALPPQDLAGKTILITAGGTMERIDGVRYMTNDSSGRMGCCIATNARDRGAKVILVLGRHTVTPPKYIDVIDVASTQDMYDKVMEYLPQANAVIMSAAPCDFRPKTYSPSKIKDKELTIHFIANPDIAQAVGKIKDNKYLVVFSAETNDLIANATAKRIKKNADLCVANDVTQAGAGFNVDTNIATFIEDKGITELPLMTKLELANKIMDVVATNIKQ